MAKAKSSKAKKKTAKSGKGQHPTSKLKAKPPIKRNKTTSRAKGPAKGETFQSLSGFLVTVPALTQQQRVQIIEQALLMIDQVYVHLPLKRAMHAIDPAQRLRLLKQRLDGYSERQFHNEMISIFTHLRDLHTNYILPEPYRSRVAFLPFRIEICFDAPVPGAGPDDIPPRHYVVTEVTGDAIKAGLKVGATIRYWNGVPIDLAVERNADREAGSNSDARLAQGLESMTNRWMGMSLPPDEYWVTLGYVSGDAGEANLREARLDWKVLVPPPPPGGGGGSVPGAERASASAPYRRRMGIDAKAEMQRRVRKLLFAPKAVAAERQMAELGSLRAHASLTFGMHLATHGPEGLAIQDLMARAGARSGSRQQAADAIAAGKSTVQPAPGSPEQAADVASGLKLKGVDLAKQSLMPDVIPKFGSVSHPAGPFAYIRIATFAVADVDEFIQEFIRIVSLLPQEGLIIDVRGNGGGVIAAGEGLLQTLTPATIVPEMFHLINTPRTLELCEKDGELRPWHASVEQALETASAFSAGLPLTPPEYCNSIGQVYQGPVVLVTDAKCYSTTDIFASGFQDHRIGIVLGTDGHTGAGGANVWEHSDLQDILPGTFKPLPAGTMFRVALRRSARVGVHAGEVLEDLGVAADPPIYRMTRNDLLGGNRDLMAHAADILSKMPRQRLTVTAAAGGNLTVTTSNITRVDLFVNHRPILSKDVNQDGTITLALPLGNAQGRRVEVQGFRGEQRVASTRLMSGHSDGFINARDPLMSIWQSVVEEKAATSPAAGLTTNQAGRADPRDPLIIGTNALIASMNKRVEANAAAARAAAGGVIPMPRAGAGDSAANVNHEAGARAHAAILDSLAETVTPSDMAAALAPRGGRVSGDVASVLNTGGHCAKLSFQIAQAQLTGDPVREAALRLNFQDGGCDPRWAECISEYLIHFKIHGQGVIPYVNYTNINDFVLDHVLPDTAIVAIVGDWGTGSDRSIHVLQEIAKHKPDMLIHLGDIYYAGTERESEIFLNLCDQHLPGVRVFTLAGNHDMYSGGKPYYDLLQKLKQPASYFCLRNQAWQLLGLDTGYNDFNPNTVDTNVTKLQDSECAWQLDKVNNSGGRKTVLMSHHQLFSGTGIGGGAVNIELNRQLSSVLDKVALWVWGHEHSHLIFDEYNGVKRGRCIGAGAIPVPIGELTSDPYRITAGLPDLNLLPPRVGADSSGLWYDCAYAILQLDGADGKLSHYQATIKDPFYIEIIT
jgi:C-terminal processing protease CtpA/Prc